MSKRGLKRSIAFLAMIVMVVSGINIDSVKSHATVVDTMPVGIHGELDLSGRQLVDANGEAFQLRGISTHGINWDVGYPYVNKASFQTLRDSWGVNAVRLAMYTKEYNGYCAGGNQTELKSLVNKGVTYATELGMYAIIDWHVLNENPNNNLTEAKAFFSEMSYKYRDSNNVIYEICNEPNNCTWDQIKSYANQIIPIILENNPDAVIIVGTPTYSQLGAQFHTNEVADYPITGYTGANIMYSLHFYANESGHNNLKAKVDYAMNKNIPILVSEFGLSAASGDGGISTRNAEDWLNKLDGYKISYFCWSLSHKNESCSLLAPSTSKTSGWTDSELSTAGQWIKNRYYTAASNEATANTPAPSDPNKITVAYWTHIQNYGWTQGWKINQEAAGTSGEGLRLEGIKVEISNAMGKNLGIRYSTHIQDIGWQDWKADGVMSGTSGQSKRLEAIKIELTGNDATNYDVYYRVHAEDFGWLGWAKNGEASGTSGQGKRLEAIQVMIKEKGNQAPGSTFYRYVEYGKVTTNTSNALGLVNYTTHVQDQGDQNYVADGSLSGTMGMGKRLESIKINLANQSIAGGITYRTHVQSIGWQEWKTDGNPSGTSGQGLRLEAIEIKLTGSMANQYDVYYRVHAQDYGWLGWAKNGSPAGTAALSKRLESIQILVLPIGSEPPLGNGNPPFVQG